jgi:hypothetical protein
MIHCVCIVDTEGAKTMGLNPDSLHYPVVVFAKTGAFLRCLQANYLLSE